jgi:DNA-binding SARP family transcriptional activator
VRAVAAQSVRLTLLGGFDVAVDGASVTGGWPTRRAAELVQLLALAPRYRLTRDEAIEALWPQLDAHAGAANLRKAAHHARRTLGDVRAIVIEQQQIALFPDADVGSDAADFAAEADAALASGDPARAAAAAVTFAGELLPSARYDDWAEPRRRRLTERYVALLRLAGDWEAVLLADPTDEAAGREAMRAALADQRRHAAIDIYGRVKAALAHQLGVAPDADTEAIYEQAIRGLAPVRRALVGRHRELAVLDDVVAVAGSTSDLVVVRGPAGIGKTALVAELVERLDRIGWVTATVAADDPGDAYGVLTRVVDRLIGADPSVTDRLDAASRSVLGVLTPAAQPPFTGPAAPTRHQIIGAVQRLVEALAADHPVLVAIDDAHRADGPSLEALAVLGDRRLGRLVVALAHRSEPGSPALQTALARAARIRPPITLELEPLRAGDARQLAAAARPDLDGDRLDELVRRSGGNPFCVLELATAGAVSGSLPGDVRRSIEARFVDLPEAATATLRRLALVEGPLDLAIVDALGTLGADATEKVLDAALDAGVLVVRDGAYAFRHELVREALADRLAPHTRAAVHRDAAQRLAALGARPGRVAAHWVLGGEPARAVDFFVEAAREALRVGGYTAAVGHLDAALEHFPAHAEALRLRATSLDALGDFRALAAYDVAIEAAPPDDVHELRPLQALAQIKMGDPVGALATVAGAEPQTLDSQLAKALTFSGAALLGATTPERGSALSAAGRKAALRAGDPGALIVAAWSNAAAAHARGELRDALRVDLADTHALPRLAVTVFDGQLCITQRLLYGNRPYDDVIGFANAFAAESSRLGAARGVAFATTLRGEAELLCGRLADADRDLEAGTDLHRAIGAATGESFALQRRAEVALAVGNRERARRLLDESLAVARGSDVGFHLFDRIYGTRIVLATDPAEAYDAALEAEEAVRGPLETCPGCRITLEVPAAIAIARAGDLDRLARYEQTCTFLAEVVMQLPAWDAALDEVRGHACLARGETNSARAHFAAATTGFAAAGQPLDASRCAALG